MHELLEGGVADNLEREAARGPAPDRLAEAERVRQRAAQATDVLERNLSRAPAAARPGLERALGASARGRDRVLKGGKGE